MYNYESARGCFPVGELYIYNSSSSYYIGPAWGASLLPYMEGTTIYNQFNFSLGPSGIYAGKNELVGGCRVAAYCCPSDPQDELLDVGTSTGGTPGGRVLWWKTDVAGVADNPDYFTRLADGSLVMVVVRRDSPTSSVGWIRSLDHGRTWSTFCPIAISLPPNYAYGPIIELPDGQWAYCPYYQDSEKKAHSLLMWSRDRGQTWSAPTQFPTPTDGNQGLSEATIAQISPNKYVAAIRSDEIATPQQWDGFYLSYSQDGLHWTVPKPTAAGEAGRMPLFYRIGDYWVLSYRQYVPSEKMQYGVLRVSRDGLKWSKPYRIEKGVNQAPFLVRVQGKLIALNNQYPAREILTRHVIDIAKLAALLTQSP